MDMTEKELDDLYEEVAASKPTELPEDDNMPEPEASGDSDADPAPTDAVAVVVTDKPAEEAGEAAPENPEAAESAADPMAEAQAKLDARAAELDAREQNLKTWEGRLKAAERPAEEPADAAAVSGDVQAAMQTIADELGSETLAQAIQAIASSAAMQAVSKVAADKVASINQRHDEMIGSFKAAFSQMHDDAVTDAMEETGVDKETVMGYVASLDGEQKAKFDAIAKGGSFPQVVRLIRLAAAWRNEQKAGDEAPVAEEAAPEAAPEDDLDALYENVLADPPSAVVKIPEKSGEDAPLTEDELADIYG